VLSFFLTQNSHLSKIVFSGGKVQVAFRSGARNARPGAVGPLRLHAQAHSKKVRM
jgi:hypothetical protein